VVRVGGQKRRAWPRRGADGRNYTFRAIRGAFSSTGLSFERSSDPIASPELSNLPPLTRSCQDGSAGIPLDSASYAGPAIASCDRVRIHGDADGGDLDCAEKDEMSSHPLCGALISRCLKATRSECTGPSAIETRMGETRRATISSRVRWSGQVVTLALGLSFTVQAATPKLQSIPIPGTQPFPESITSTSDGVLFVGRLGDGGIVRVKPRTAETTVFVQPGALGSRSILGVFADEASNTLWACSNDLSALGGPATGRDTGSALKAFDLKTGAGKRSVSLPGSHAFCNDITVDSKGSVYVTDSANPTILRLSPGATTFEVFASSQQFVPPRGGGAGLDGIAFGSDGNLYVTTYVAGELFRIDIERGGPNRVTKLHGPPLAFPDALRPFGESSFLLVQGAGTLDRVDIEGDEFKTAPIHGGFREPTSVARVDSTAWVSEGQLSFFFDRPRKTQSPTLPFQIYAVPLSKGQTQ